MPFGYVEDDRASLEGDKAVFLVRGDLAERVRRHMRGHLQAGKDTSRTSYGRPASSRALRTRVSRARPLPPSGDH